MGPSPDFQTPRTVLFVSRRQASSVTSERKKGGKGVRERDELDVDRALGSTYYIAESFSSVLERVSDSGHKSSPLVESSARTLGTGRAPRINRGSQLN